MHLVVGSKVTALSFFQNERSHDLDQACVLRHTLLRSVYHESSADGFVEWPGQDQSSFQYNMLIHGLRTLIDE
jgi:hypothetical protein